MVKDWPEVVFREEATCVEVLARPHRRHLHHQAAAILSARVIVSVWRSSTNGCDGVRVC